MTFPSLHTSPRAPSHPGAIGASAVAGLRDTAFSLVFAGQEDQAIDVLQQALARQPGEADLFGDVAAIRLRQGRHPECISAARAALERDPLHDESAYALAVSLAELGQTHEAQVLHEALGEGTRAARFHRAHPALAQRSRAEAGRLRALILPPPRPGTPSRPTPTGALPPSTRFDTDGPGKYQIDHLVQGADQRVGGPIQDDEALVMYALVRSMRMRRVLEVGGLSGYSARNFLVALGDETDAAVYTCDLDPVSSQAPHHHVLTKDCGQITLEDLHHKPLDLIFFDAHVLEPQLALLARLEAAGLLLPRTVLALHDTNLHPCKTAPWSYPIVDTDGASGHVHQAVERRMVNTLQRAGWQALCLHMGGERSDPRLPVRHGLTLMQRFTPLAT